MTEDERSLLIAVAKVVMADLDTPRSQRMQIQELIRTVLNAQAESTTQ